MVEIKPMDESYIHLDCLHGGPVDPPAAPTRGGIWQNAPDPPAILLGANQQQVLVLDQAAHHALLLSVGARPRRDRGPPIGLVHLDAPLQALAPRPNSPWFEHHPHRTAAGVYLRTAMHTMGHLWQVWALRGAMGAVSESGWPQQHYT